MTAYIDTVSSVVAVAPCHTGSSVLNSGPDGADKPIAKVRERERALVLVSVFRPPVITDPSTCPVNPLCFSRLADLTARVACAVGPCICLPQIRRNSNVLLAGKCSLMRIPSFNMSATDRCPSCLDALLAAMNYGVR